MKNKQRFLKLVAVVTVAVIMVFSLASCAVGGTSAANDASGEHGELKWEYKKDGQTLTITGKGEMGSFDNVENVAWSKVSKSVKKVVIGSGITTVGNYAFYGMSALSEVRFDGNVTKIGKLAFAFTPALESIDLPDSVSAVEYGAFEASGIKAIALPALVTTVSERAFIYCDDLTSVVAPSVTEVKAQAFAYCKSLDSVKLVKDATVAADAFANAKIDASKITVADNKITITYKFVDAADTTKEIKTAETEQKDANAEPYIYKSPVIEGYEATQKDVMVTPGEVNLTVSISYNKLEAETESETAVETQPVGGDEDNKLEPMTIVALVVTVLIIIGIIVGTVLFIRNDKKNAGKNGTVRKNKDDKKGSKDKKNNK